MDLSSACGLITFLPYNFLFGLEIKGSRYFQVEFNKSLSQMIRENTYENELLATTEHYWTLWNGLS